MKLDVDKALACLAGRASKAWEAGNEDEALQWTERALALVKLANEGEVARLVLMDAQTSALAMGRRMRQG